MESINKRKSIIFGTWLNFSDKTSYEWESFFESFLSAKIFDNCFSIIGSTDLAATIMPKTIKINIKADFL